MFWLVLPMWETTFKVSYADFKLSVEDVVC